MPHSVVVNPTEPLVPYRMKYGEATDQPNQIRLSPKRRIQRLRDISLCVDAIVLVIVEMDLPAVLGRTVSLRNMYRQIPAVRAAMPVKAYPHLRTRRVP